MVQAVQSNDLFIRYLFIMFCSCCKRPDTTWGFNLQFDVMGHIYEKKNYFTDLEQKLHLYFIVLWSMKETDWLLEFLCLSVKTTILNEHTLRPDASNMNRKKIVKNKIK